MYTNVPTSHTATQANQESITDWTVVVVVVAVFRGADSVAMKLGTVLRLTRMQQIMVGKIHGRHGGFSKGEVWNGWDKHKCDTIGKEVVDECCQCAHRLY